MVRSLSDILEDPRFPALTGTAVKTLLLMWDRSVRSDGRPVTLTYAEARRYGMSHRAYATALRHLQDIGWLAGVGIIAANGRTMRYQVFPQQEGSDSHAG